MKKMLVDFQICISVPLSKPREDWLLGGTMRNHALVKYLCYVGEKEKGAERKSKDGRKNN